MKLFRNVVPFLMNRSFFTKLFVSIFLVAFVGLFSMTIAYRYYFQKVLVDIETERVQRSINQAALNLQNQLQRIMNDMFYFFVSSDTGTQLLEAEVSDSYITDDMAKAQKTLELFRLRYTGELESVFFYRKDRVTGQETFFHDNSLNRNRELDYQKQQWYRYFEQKLDRAWSRPSTEHLFYEDRSYRTVWLTIGKYDDKHREGIFVVRLNAKIFSDTFRLLTNQNLRIDLLQQGDQLVYSSDSSVPYAPNDNWLETTSELEGTDFHVRALINKQSILETVNNIQSIRMAIFVVMLAVTLLISIVLSLTLVRPVKKLLRLMKKVETGDFDVRFPIKYTDEVGKLGLGFNKMVTNVSELIREVYVIRIDKMEADLRQKEATILAMQNQINPHFLYNTLEAINCHAIVNDVPSISHMSKALADFFRYSIDKQQIDVPLYQEIAHIRTYLQIQQERYPEIEIDIAIPGSCLSHTIIKLTLQPIIENAYYHAFTGERDYYLTISAEPEGERAYAIFVEDNGEGMEERQLERINERLASFGSTELYDSGSHSRHGIGLGNVHSRIRLHYGEPYGISLSDSVTGGLKVKILLPKEPLFRTRTIELTGRSKDESTSRGR